MQINTYASGTGDAASISTMSNSTVIIELTEYDVSQGSVIQLVMPSGFSLSIDPATAGSEGETTYYHLSGKSIS